MNEISGIKDGNRNETDSTDSQFYSESEYDETPTGRHKVVMRKVRQHVNPLRSQYQLPTVLAEDWITKTYKTPGKFAV